MKKITNEILSVKALSIGYLSGKTEKVLLPPLTTGANSGELVAVIGRNGIGKSTLLRTLTGIQKSLGGEIFYSGKNLKDHSRMELAQKVGYISTEIVKVSNMTVYDLVALGRFPHTNWIGKIEPGDHEVIIDALEKTSMVSFRGHFVAELSDGERQKTMIARILAQDTGIMIMDEPTAFLDVASRYEILHLLHRLTRESNKTIIFSTHDLQMALSQSDKIWLILGDKLIEGAPEDLMIAGAFDHLFDSSAIVFNPEDGTCSFSIEPKGSIFIMGEGQSRSWTEKAFTRAGYNISKEQTFPYVIVPSESYEKWRVVTHDKQTEFASIYEMISSLEDDI